MSADSWDTCPRCLAKVEKEKADRVIAMNDAYGKVSVEEYMSLVAEAERSINLEQTLREDYELGIASKGHASFAPNTFYVYYRANCQVCSFKLYYDYEVLVEVGE